MFGLKILAMFQHINMEIFGDYILVFMQVFLDDFFVYNKKVGHLEHLWLCL